MRPRYRVLVDLKIQKHYFNNPLDASFRKVLETWIMYDDIFNLMSFVCESKGKWFRPSKMRSILDKQESFIQLEDSYIPSRYSNSKVTRKELGDTETAIARWWETTTLRRRKLFLNRYLTYVYFLAIDSSYLASFLLKRVPTTARNEIVFTDKCTPRRAPKEFIIYKDEVYLNVSAYFGIAVSLKVFEKEVRETFTNEFLSLYRTGKYYRLDIVFGVVHKALLLNKGTTDRLYESSQLYSALIMDFRNFLVKKKLVGNSEHTFYIHSVFDVELSKTYRKKLMSMVITFWAKVRDRLLEDVPVGRPEHSYNCLMGTDPNYYHRLEDIRGNVLSLLPYKDGNKSTFSMLTDTYLSNLDHSVVVNSFKEW